MRKVYLFISLICCLLGYKANSQVAITGELKKWHKVTLTFDGVDASESDSINPFTDYRLNVTFTNGSKSYLIPGYFAADGNAAETSAESGNKWRVHFSPDQTGTWIYTVSFRTGDGIAVSDDVNAGMPVAPLDGLSGPIEIDPTDKTGKDFRAKGRVQYTGGRYLQFGETKGYFLKGGANSPENFLAYYEFDGTYNVGGTNGLPNGLHHFAPHETDWNTGDPTWQSGKGKGIIGALNYLASEDMDVLYFMTMNITGDGDDVWPYISPSDTARERFDVSKLDQWEIVFSHMDSLGIMLHVVTQERENQTLLDNGDVGPERKLYYRELIARFSHHLGIIWNLGEENGYDFLGRGTQTNQQRKDMATYFKEHDPYQHFVTVHNFTNQLDSIFHPLLGFSNIDGMSMQYYAGQVHDETKKWIDSSYAHNKPWVVNHDETNGGVDVNGGNHDMIRKQVLWGNLMAGGGGIEIYFGGGADLDTEDFSTRSNMWGYTRYALEFFHDHLPFWRMKHQDEITSNTSDYCFGQPGQIYAIYLPYGGTTGIDLPCGEYTVQWYDPQNGGSLKDGDVTSVTGGGSVNIGNPPYNTSNDWAAIVKNEFFLSFDVINAGCSNADGMVDLIVGGGTAPFSYAWSNGDTTQDISNISSGSYSVTVTDSSGCSVTSSVEVYQTTRANTILNPVICDNDSLFAGGAFQHLPGTYIDTFDLANGCDSLVVTNLIVLPTYSDTNNISICDGESYFAEGTFQDTSGTYIDTFTASNGCDSVVTTELTVLPTFNFTQNISICDNDSFRAGGAAQTAAGTYYDTLAAVNGCDSVIITNLSILPTFFTTNPVTICDNVTYFAGGAAQNTSGIYYDTLIAVNGCDSVIETNLTVLSTFTTNRSVTICANETFFVGGGMQSASGTYYDTLAASNGCDSVIITSLTVLPTFETTVPVIICDNESYLAAGSLQTSTGTYYDTLAALNGCDSVIITELTVLPTYSFTQNISICDNESFIAGGSAQTIAGTYYDTLVAVNGCDSVITTNLSVLQTFFTTNPVTICDNQTYFAGGEPQSASGLYYDTLNAVNACDSIVETQLTVISTFVTNNPVTICDNETYFAGGASRNTSGIYYDTLTSASNCDSVIITNLTVLPTFNTIDPVTICDNETYFAEGAPRNVTGLYFDTLPANNGCDSVVVTALTVLPTFTENLTITICDNDSLLAGGGYQNTTGTYYDTLTAANGCDSVVITDLTVLPTFSTLNEVTICENESYFAGGSLQNTGGTYYDTLTAANGCDSVVITDLTVLSVFVDSINITICDDEQYFAGGAMQNTSGVYFDTLLSAGGCDSVIITGLTVFPTYSITIPIVICDDASFFAEGAFQNTTGLYYDSLTTIHGCDSIIITDLTVLPTYTKINNITICDNETYFAGGAPQNASGLYYDTLTAANGCDSVIITVLNVLPTYFKPIDITICNTETYYAGGESQNTSGTYYDTLTAVNGCDSVIMTRLTVYPTYVVNETAVICDNATYFAGGTSQNTSGTYYDTLSTINGCDSVIITDLTVLPTFTTTNPVTICDNESYFAAGADRHTSGTYFDTLAATNGCDSVIITELTVFPTKAKIKTISICENETYYAGGDSQSTSGIYYDTLATSHGCDSIIVTFLTVRQTYLTVDPVSICANESYYVQGDYQTRAGLYFDTLAAVNGCDSVILTELTVKPVYVDTMTLSICEGDVAFLQGALQDAAGLYVDTFSSMAGCDSVVYTDLLVNPNESDTIDRAICLGDSIFLQGEYQTTDGVYVDTFTNELGCDSVVYVDLRVRSTIVTTMTLIACRGESVFVGGAYQTTSGVFNDTLTASGGCDSVVATSLFFTDPELVNVDLEICDGDSILLEGAFQTTAGVYVDTFQSVFGCDSIVISHLTISPIFSQVLPVTICENDSILAGGDYRSTAGLYYDTLTTLNGCDSVIITDLSVLPTFSVTVPVSICDNETYFAAGANRNSTGTYVDTFQAVNGCDSMVVTELTVLPTAATVLSETICAGESYFAGGTFQTQSGTYHDTLIAVNGCDSIVTTQLTVVPATSEVVAVSICEGDSFYAGGIYRFNNGLFRDTLSDANGCDSIVVTSLTVIPPKSKIFPITICDNESYFAEGASRNMPGLYYDTFATSLGCDSVIITALSVWPSYQTSQSVTICDGDSFFVGGAFQKSTQTYYDTLTANNGCDSIVATELTVRPTYLDTITTTICDNTSFFAQGAFRNVSGIYIDSFSSTHGCDSVIVNDLTVIPTSETYRSFTICDDDSIFAQGRYRNTSGLYYDTLVAGNGCDSVVITELIVHPSYAIHQTASICQGDSVFAEGTYRVTSGTYYDTFSTNAGCDSILITEVIVESTIHTNRNVTICEGDSIFVGGAEQSVAGTYYDTLVASAGCDSVVITDLTLLSPDQDSIEVVLCYGDSLFVGGKYQSGSGVYFDTLQSGFGCDSIVVTNLSVLPPVTTNQSIAICDDERFFAGGAMQTAAGTYYDTLTAVNGCDSVLITDLTIIPTLRESIEVDICVGESYFVGGGLQNSAGVYYDTLQGSNSCDSIITTTLRVWPVLTVFNPVSICAGESYFAGGTLRTAPGIYYDTLISSRGCDSIVITALSVLPSVTKIVTTTICDNETYFAGGDLQNSSGIYYDTLTANTGCDSILITFLTVLDSYASINEMSICDGDSIFAGGAFRSTTGTYYDTLQAINGCDSLIITDLTVNSSYSDTVAVSICANETYFAGGVFQNSSGMYADTFNSTVSCDSIIFTDLEVLPLQYSTIVASICEGENFRVGNNYLDSSGIYIDTLSAASGCDSVVNVDLTVLPAVREQLELTLCQGESVFFNGAFRTTTGIYRDTLVASNGCDSIVTLDLQIIPNYSVINPVSICEGEFYFAGGAPRNAAGIYRDTLTASNGCDSVIITALTVLPSTTKVVQATICQGESYFAGGSFQTTGGLYYDTLTRSNACDSIVATVLTVIPIEFNTVSVNICHGEQYFAGGAYRSTSGIYFDTLMAGSGCDSVVATELTVLPEPVSNVTVTICANETYFAGGEQQNSSGTYYDTLSTVNGCDSVVITHLSVLPTFSGTRDLEICQGDSVFAEGKYRFISGLYFDSLTASDGCDSVVMTDLKVIPPRDTALQVTICSGESYFAGGALQNRPGIYRDTISSTDGCDSIVLTDLRIAPVYSFANEVAICQGDSIFAQGAYRKTHGTYFDTLASQEGCDSVIVTDLTILSNSLTNLSESICQGDSIFLAGAYQTNGGTYFDTLTGHHGCDSILATDLYIVPSVFTTILDTICQGDSLYIGGGMQSMSGTYYDTLTGSNGCDSILVTQLAINPLPNADAGADKEICQGEVDTLYASGGITYQWSNGVSGSTNVVNPLNSRTYVVTVTNPEGCRQEDSAYVKVHPLPNVSFSGLDASYCTNDTSDILTGQPSGGTFSGSGMNNNVFSPGTINPGNYLIIYSYTDNNGCSDQFSQQVDVLAVPNVSFTGWQAQYCQETADTFSGTPSGGFFSGPGMTGDIFMASVAGIGDHTISYHYEAANGCAATAEETVHVMPLPQLAFSLPDSNICVDEQPLELEAQPEGGEFRGAGIIDSLFDPPSAGVGGPYSLSYTFVDSNGCENSLTQNIIVHDLPSVNMAPLPNFYCENIDPVVLTGTPAHGVFSGAGVNGNTFLPGQAGLGTHQIMYVYTDSFGCQNSASDIVEIVEAPSVSINGIDPYYCIDDPVDIMNGTPPGGVFAGQGVVVNVFDPGLAGSGGPYTVTYGFTNSFGCTTIDTQMVIVSEKPELQIIGLDSAFCVNDQPITLTGIPGGGTFTGAGVQNSRFNPATAGVGTHLIVYIYSDSACTNISKTTVNVEVCTSVKDIPGLDAIDVFPNPFDNRITIAIESANERELNISLTDLLGRRIYHQNANLLQGYNTINIHLYQQLAAGMYLLKLDSGGRQVIYRLFKN